MPSPFEVDPRHLGRGAEASAALAFKALRRIIRALRLSDRAAEQQVGITGAQLFVLQQLARSPVHSLKELAHLTLTHPSSVSVVVSRLAARRLVTRVASDTDARRVEISLTRSGRLLLARAPRAAQARLIASLKNLPRRELVVLTDALHALAAAVDPESLEG